MLFGAAVRVFGSVLTSGIVVSLQVLHVCPDGHSGSVLWAIRI